MPRVNATVSEKIEKKIEKYQKQFGLTKSRTIEKLVDLGIQSLEGKAMVKLSTQSVNQ